MLAGYVAAPSQTLEEADCFNVAVPYILWDDLEAPPLSTCDVAECLTAETHDTPRIHQGSRFGLMRTLKDAFLCVLRHITGFIPSRSASDVRWCRAIHFWLAHVRSRHGQIRKLYETPRREMRETREMGACIGVQTVQTGFQPQFETTRLGPWKETGAL